MNGKLKKKIKVIFCLLCTLLLIIFHIKTNVNPVLIVLFEEQVKTLANIAVNNACDSVVSSYDLNLMINYKYNANGKLEVINVNSALANKISKEIMLKSEYNISDLGKNGVSVPIGALSGITYLSGKGPILKVNACPSGSIGVYFNSDFQSVGINHTKHSIYLVGNSSISIVVPGLNHSIRTSTTVLLCENLIIGEVPDGIIYGNSFSQP